MERDYDFEKERNSLINDPVTLGSTKEKENHKTNVTTSLNFDIWKLAKENKIAWNDALEFGIKFLIADKNEFDYPECNLQKKVSTLSKKLSLKSQECESLRDQMEIKEDA